MPRYVFALPLSIQEEVVVEVMEVEEKVLQHTIEELIACLVIHSGSMAMVTDISSRVIKLALLYSTQRINHNRCAQFKKLVTIVLSPLASGLIPATDREIVEEDLFLKAHPDQHMMMTSRKHISVEMMKNCVYIK